MLNTLRWKESSYKPGEIVTQSFPPLLFPPQVYMQLVQMWVRPSAVRVRTFTLTWHNVLALPPFTHTLSLSFCFIVIQWGSRQCTGSGCRQILQPGVWVYIFIPYTGLRIVLYLISSAMPVLYFVPGCPTSINHISIAGTPQPHPQWMFTSRGQFAYLAPYWYPCSFPSISFYFPCTAWLTHF